MYNLFLYCETKLFMSINSKFKEKVWSDFKPNYVFEKLLSSNRFNPNNRIILSALSAWVIAPNDDELRQNAITLRVNEIIGKIEKTIIKNSTRSTLFDDHLNLVNKRLKRGFYREIYYPIGGLRAFNNSISSELYTKNISVKHAQHIAGINKVLSIIHYHQEKITDYEKYNPPSLKICKDVIDKIRHSQSLYNSYSSIQSALRERGRTAHFCYAASIVPIKNKNFTLLDVFCDPEKQIDFDPSHLKVWLSYSKFVQLQLIKPLLSDYLKKIQKVKNKHIEPENFKPAELSYFEKTALLEKSERKFNKRGKNKIQ